MAVEEHLACALPGSDTHGTHAARAGASGASEATDSSITAAKGLTGSTGSTDEQPTGEFLVRAMASALRRSSEAESGSGSEGFSALRSSCQKLLLLLVDTYLDLRRCSRLADSTFACVCMCVFK